MIRQRTSIFLTTGLFNQYCLTMHEIICQEFIMPTDINKIPKNSRVSILKKSTVHYTKIIRERERAQNEKSNF